MLQQQLSGPTGVGPFIGRWVVVIAGSTAVLVAADRVTRHLLPIAALYQVALVFPDRAPSRYKVALRSGSSARWPPSSARAVTSGTRRPRRPRTRSCSSRISAEHDRLTRGHSERVRAYSEIIAEEMELPAADLEKLRWAALIHDVGKMAVSPEILNKPGRPTDEEWQELRNHPAAAARMLAPLEPWLGEWIGAATEHHERVDGKGYPRGLRGEEISLAGRIVAVADAYDCMTSARSYKKALPPEQARFELSRNAGTQFDPEVVRAFLNVSVGRLHLAGGPLAWLSSVPGVRDVATGLSGAPRRPRCGRRHRVGAGRGRRRPAPAVVDEPDNGSGRDRDRLPDHPALPPRPRRRRRAQPGRPRPPADRLGRDHATSTARHRGRCRASDHDHDHDRARRCRPRRTRHPAEPPTTEAPTTTSTTSTTAADRPRRTEPTTTTDHDRDGRPRRPPRPTAPTTDHHHDDRRTDDRPRPRTTTTDDAAAHGGRPNAVNDSRTVQSGSSTNIDVLANDIAIPDARPGPGQPARSCPGRRSAAPTSRTHRQESATRRRSWRWRRRRRSSTRSATSRGTLRPGHAVRSTSSSSAWWPSEQGAAPESQLLAVIPEPERRRRGWRVRRPVGPHG